MSKDADETADATTEKKAKDKPPSFDWYDPHPMLGLFPAPTELDLEMMKADVAMHGVKQQIVLWKGPRGKLWLIDGRTRQEGAKRAWDDCVAQEKDTVAQNGVSLQPDTWVYSGTMEEVYQFMKSTHIRKHYLPGQKAAMGVRLYYHEFKAKHGDKLPKTVDDEIKSDGTTYKYEGAATAEELAARFGTNHYYIRICKSLYREATDLLDAVAAGVIPPPKAAAQLTARKAGDAAIELEEGEERDTDAEPDAIRDADGKLVPKCVEEAFQSRAAFEQLAKTLATVSRQSEVVAASAGGKFMDHPTFARQLNALRRHVTKTKPMQVCPACDGKGHKPGQRYTCSTCQGHGFVCKLITDAAKKAAEAGEGGGGDKKSGRADKGDKADKAEPATADA